MEYVYQERIRPAALAEIAWVGDLVRPQQTPDAGSTSSCLLYSLLARVVVVLS